MSLPKRILRTIASAGLAAGLTLGVMTHAGQVIEFVQTSPTPPDPGSPNWPATIQLPKFDLSLGTLTGIGFTFTSTVNGQVGFENEQLGASNTIDYQLPLTAEFLLPTVPTSTVQNILLTGSSGVLGSYDGVSDFAGTSGATVNLTPASGISYATVQPAQFGSYTRSGAPETYNLSVYLDRGSATFTPNSAKAYSASDMILAQVRVDVSYTYTPSEVPEGTPWVGGIGLTTLAVAMRRRRRR